MGEEESQARYYDRLACGLDTIKESPSTASMAGALQGGLSSASVNTVLQASQSTTSVPGEIPPSPGGPKTNMMKESRISEEKDMREAQDTTSESTEDSSAAKPVKAKHKAKRSETKQLQLDMANSQKLEKRSKEEEEAERKQIALLDEAEKVLMEAAS